MFVDEIQEHLSPRRARLSAGGEPRNTHCTVYSGSFLSPFRGPALAGPDLLGVLLAALPARDTNSAALLPRAPFILLNLNLDVHLF